MAMRNVRDVTSKAKAKREASAAAKATAKAHLEDALKAAKKDKEAAERALDEANATITRSTNELEQNGHGMGNVERGVEDLSLEERGTDGYQGMSSPEYMYDAP